MIQQELLEYNDYSFITYRRHESNWIYKPRNLEHTIMLRYNTCQNTKKYRTAFTSPKRAQISTLNFNKKIQTPHWRQPPKANSAFHPSGVGKRVPASAGKAKAGMVHSVSGWTRVAQVKLWDPLRTRVIPERLRGVFTTRRYTNTRLPLPLPDAPISIQNLPNPTPNPKPRVW